MENLNQFSTDWLMSRWERLARIEARFASFGAGGEYVASVSRRLHTVWDILQARGIDPRKYLEKLDGPV